MRILKEQLCISHHNPIRARTYDYPKFTYPWHCHGEYELIYVENGSGKCLIGDSAVDYSDRSLLIFGSALPHCMQNDSSYDCGLRRVDGVIVQFEKDFMQYSFSNYVQFAQINSLLAESCRGICIDVEAHDEIRRKVLDIPNAKGFRQIIDLLELLQMIAELPARTVVASPHCGQIPAEQSDAKLEKVMSYISHRYTKRINLDDIASCAAMNPSAFCRYFHEKTGKTLSRHIADMRIGYACRLLADGNLSISQIGLECGFESASGFNRTFLRITGMTPTEYRTRLLKR